MSGRLLSDKYDHSGFQNLLGAGMVGLVWFCGGIKLTSRKPVSFPYNSPDE